MHLLPVIVPYPDHFFDNIVRLEKQNMLMPLTAGIVRGSSV